ncbi:hypothetical protein GCM10009836_24960 [Pseudonocardia ailaonensis]|uniref:Uncharacterized protein n=2 Tax=Actinomycetes TaxID=1760 RepID=A0ABN3HG78_9ACTN
MYVLRTAVRRTDIYNDEARYAETRLYDLPLRSARPPRAGPRAVTKIPMVPATRIPPRRRARDRV